jgi:hypothetical protein
MIHGGMQVTNWLLSSSETVIDISFGVPEILTVLVKE